MKVGAVVLAVGLALAGCAQTGAGSDFSAEELQQQVLEVTTSSAEEDYAGAIARLAVLEVSVKDALARGELTQARYDSIMAAIELVRADLETAAGEPSPTPTEEGKGNPGKGNDDGKGNHD